MGQHRASDSDALRDVALPGWQASLPPLEPCCLAKRVGRRGSPVRRNVQLVTRLVPTTPRAAGWGRVVCGSLPHLDRCTTRTTQMAFAGLLGSRCWLPAVFCGVVAIRGIGY